MLTHMETELVTNLNDAIRNGNMPPQSKKMDTALASMSDLCAFYISIF